MPVNLMRLMEGEEILKKKNRSRSRTDLGREIIERRTFGYADGSRKMEK